MRYIHSLFGWYFRPQSTQSSNGWVKLAQAGEVEGCTPTPFITFTITSKVAAYAPAAWADTLTLFRL